MNQFKIVFGIAVLVGVSFSCKKKNKVTCNGTNPKYNTEIKTLIDNNCMPCHGPGGDETDYSTYAKISPILSNGKFEKEVLTKQTMPTNKSFSNDELSAIQCWVDNNYLEN